MLLLTENYDFQGESSPPPEFKKSRPGQIPVCVPDEASTSSTVSLPYLWKYSLVNILLVLYLTSLNCSCLFPQKSTYLTKISKEKNTIGSSNQWTSKQVATFVISNSQKFFIFGPTSRNARWTLFVRKFSGVVQWGKL